MNRRTQRLCGQHTSREPVITDQMRGCALPLTQAQAVKLPLNPSHMCSITSLQYELRTSKETCNCVFPLKPENHKEDRRPKKKFKP